MFGLAGQTGWLAPPTVVAHAIDVITFHTLGWTVRLGALVLLAWGMWSLGRAVWRRASTGATPATEQAAIWGWALVRLMLLGPILTPWSVVWGLPLFGGVPGVPGPT